MREVFASINYVINKLEEKNLFKIAQEGHDIFAAIYRFVGDGEGGLNRADDDKNDQYYESTAPSNMFENDLYNPLEKTRQTKWRVKSEVPSDYSKPSATEAPSTETSTPSSAAPSAGTTTSTTPGPGTSSITVTTPSSYSGGTEGTPSGASSTTGAPQGSGPSFSTGSGASTVDPSEVEYFDLETLIHILDDIVKAKDTTKDILKEKYNPESLMKALDVLWKLGLIRLGENKVVFNTTMDKAYNILTDYMNYHKLKINNSSAEANDDEMIDEDPNENPNEVRQIGERNNPTNDEAKMLGGSDSTRLLGEKTYATSLEEIRKNQEKLDGIVKNLDRILYMGDATEVKFLLSSFLKNKELIDLVSDPDFETKYNVNSNTMMSIEFIPYPGASRVGLKINGKTVLKPAIDKPGTRPVSAKKVLSMTNTFITNLENFGLKREADAMHDVFVKIANAYDLVNRPGVSVQAKKWIQDNVANIDAMTNIQLVNMMASLPLNVQTELKQIITQYKGTQGYKQNKPMGYQQPNQQGYQQPYQQGYQQGYQQQNMYGNQGGMVRPQ
jgi:hypothetical protein